VSTKASAKASKKSTAAKPAKKGAPAKVAKTTKAGKKPAPKAKVGTAAKSAAPKAKAAKAKPTAKAKTPPARKPLARKPAPAKPAAAAKARARKKGAAPSTGTLRARVLVYPRREILDPQGKAIRNALAGIGFDQVEDVRAGKSFEITLSGKAARAGGRPRELLTAMCERLLANSVVEDYAIELSEEEAGEQDGRGGQPA
jgi:phosphoribosylformylglycinamidine synthase